jgi:hypothetical protein
MTLLSMKLTRVVGYEIEVPWKCTDQRVKQGGRD